MTAPEEGPASQPDEWGYDLLLQGTEQLLRASDTGILVAFAAMAYEQIRGDKLPRSDLGFALLLGSVLLCAMLHFLIGGAYVRRARKLIQGQAAGRSAVRMRGGFITLAWIAGILQFGCIIAGLVLVLWP
jgi:hypothetical protein